MIDIKGFTPSSIPQTSYHDSIAPAQRNTCISLFDMFPGATKVVSNRKLHDANFAFLSTTLAKLHKELYEPIYEVHYTEDIDIDYGGGFVDYVSYFTVDWAGIMNDFRTVVGNNANYLARVNAGLNKKQVNVYTWEVAYDLRFVELEKLKQVELQKSIEAIYKDIIVAGWDMFCEVAVYEGINGGLSLFNNPNVYKSTIDNNDASAANSGFTGMTDTAVASCFNGIYAFGMRNSNNNLAVLPDVFLVPSFVGQDLSGRMSPLYTSNLREFIRKHNLAADEKGGDYKIRISTRPLLDTMGVGGHGRIVAYRKNKRFERIDIPYPMQQFITLPNMERMSYTTAFVGQISEVQLPYSTSDAEFGPISYWDFIK